MSLMEEYSSILDEYKKAAFESQHKKRGLSGIFGIGPGPGDDPCHKAVDDQVGALCLRAAEEGSPAELRELTEAILKAQNEWEGSEVARLMLAATQRHTLPLIPQLSPADRAELGTWYEKEYPRRKRVPVQDEILKALKG